MSDTPRLANIGKYMRDRYTDDLDGEKRAMVEARLNQASREDLQKTAGPMDWFKSLSGVGTKLKGMLKKDPGPKLYQKAVVGDNQGGGSVGKSGPTTGTYGLGENDKIIAERRAKLERLRAADKGGRSPGGSGGVGRAVGAGGQSMTGGSAGQARAGQPGKKPGTLNP